MLKKIIQASIYGLVLLVPIFFLPFTVEIISFNKVYLLIALTSIGFFAWIAKMIFQDKAVRVKLGKFDIVVLAFLVIMALSAILAKDQTSSVFGDYGRFWPSLVGFITLGAFYFLLTNNIAHQRQININQESGSLNGDEQEPIISYKGVLKSFLISSAVAVGVGYLSVFNVLGGIASKLGLNLGQPFNPVAISFEGLAVFCAFLAALLIALTSLQDRSDAQEISGNATFRYVLLFASLGLLMIIDFVPAWLSLTVAVALFLVIAFAKRVLKENIGKLGLSIAVLILALAFIFTNPLKMVFPSDTAFLNLPGEVLLKQGPGWQLALEGVKGDPILGSGVGGFSYAFSMFKPQSFLQDPYWQARLNRSSSHMAEMVTTTGIVGGLSYVILLGMFLVLGYKMLVGKKNKAGIALLVGFLALLAGQFFYYQNITLAFSFWMMLALVAALWKASAKEKVFQFKDFPEMGLVLSVVFWMMLVGFAFFGFSLTKAYIADADYRAYLKDPQTNITKLEKAVELNGSRVVYRLALAGFYLDEVKMEAAKQTPDIDKLSRDVGVAVEQARAAVASAPNRVETQEAAAVIYRDIQGLAKGSSEWAIKSFEAALALEPNNPGFLSEIAGIYSANGDKEQARDYFNRAVALKPDFLAANLQLAVMGETEGDLEGSIKRLEGLLQNNYNSIDLHFQLGRLYYNNKQYDKAQEQFLVCLSMFPNHSNSIYALALVYEQQGDTTSALAALEKVLELNPSNQNVQDKINILRAQQFGAAAEEVATQEIETEESDQ